MIIKLKIDVTKLKKERFYRAKSGAIYADLVLMENRDGANEYGDDGFVTQDKKKDENIKLPIIGNWRVIGGDKPRATPAARERQPEPTSGDEIPF